MRRSAVLVVLLSCTTACGSTVAMVSTQTTAPGATNGGLSIPSTIAPGPAAAAAGPVTQATTGASIARGGSAEPSPGPSLVTSLGTTRGPLKIGVLYTDNGAANAALGVATSASSGPKAVMSALIAALNRTGGLAGRTLVADYYAVDATSSDYSTQANAACAHFTQDARVPVVLDLAFGNKFGMAACLAKSGVADFGLGTSDTVADNSVGLYAAPSSMTSTRRYPAVLTGLHATGYLTSKNKIGVLLEGCPDLQRAYKQAVVPAISRLGLVLADTESLDCTAGFSSAGPASAAVQSAVLRFRSRGVDRLLMVSDFEQVTLLLLANEAESQGWRPGFMLSSTAQTEVMRANIASGQWPQLHGVGWSPGLDIDDPHQPLQSADTHCLDLVKQGGVTVSGWQNTYVATTECAEVLFLGAALRDSNGNAQGRALMTAVNRLGSSFTAPGIVQDKTFFGSGRYDGPAAVAPFAYVAACSCLKYVGPPLAAA